MVGAKNSVLKLMAAALLAPGRDDDRQPARHLRRVDHARAARRGWAARSPRSRDGSTDSVQIDCAGRPAVRGAVRTGPQDPRLDQPARPAADPHRPGPGRAAGRRRHRLAAARHALRRARADGRRDPGRARLRRRRGRPAAGRTDLARLPERRRDREHPDRRRAGQGHHGDRQRRPRAGDRRPVPHARVDGRRDRRHRLVDARDRRRGRTCTRTRHVAVADRIVAGTWACAAVATRGDITVRGARRRAPRDRARQAGPLGRRRRRPAPTASGCGWTDRPKQLRRRDAALSRACRPTCSRRRSRCCRSPTAPR